MVDYKDYLEEKYQFSLKELSFNRVENQITDTQVRIRIKDNIDTLLDENKLLITFTRKLFFEPESIFEIQVIFDILISLKKDAFDVLKNIDLSKELSEKDNPYLSNIIARASSIIANITASYGQQPIITSPGFIKEE